MKHAFAFIAALLVTPFVRLSAAEPVKLSDGLLAPSYSIIAQLPPNQKEGFFLAPSLAKMPSGALIAAVPWGPSRANRAAGDPSLRSLKFYRSRDGGATWKHVSEQPYDSSEPNMLVYEGRLYLLITPNLGMSKRSYFPRDGKWGVWAAASDDEGATWSPVKRVIEAHSIPGLPAPEHRTGGQTAMVIRDGKLYLSVSDAGQKMAAVSVNLDQGILNPDAWRISEMVEMPIPAELVYEPFKGGITPESHQVVEGNVVEVSGRLLVIARAIINGGATANMGAIFEILDRPSEPLRLRFLQLYPIPGGQLKFYIQHDTVSRLYWMASNLPANSAFLVDQGPWSRAKSARPAEMDRRSLTLWYSVDALNWIPAGWVARTQGWTQSFHYPVMLIDGDDLALISRTGRNSGDQHNVDTVTFHRIKNFRKLAVDLTPTFQISLNQ